MLLLKREPTILKPKKRFPERKRMTIAAGMICDKGVVFGADTEESIGDLRGRVHKIPMIFDPPSMITGACQNGHLMDTAVERLFDQLQNGKFRDSRSVGQMVDKVMVGLYSREFKVYPDQASTPMRLLVAVKPHDDTEVSTWSIDCSVVRRMKPVEIVGYGHLIQFVADHLYQSPMNLENGMFAMVQIVAMAKKMVQSVGGESYVHILRDDGTFSGENFYFSPEAEGVYQFFMTHGRQLLLATGSRVEMTEAQFDQIASRFIQMLKWQRERLCGKFTPSSLPSNPEKSSGQQ